MSIRDNTQSFALSSLWRDTSSRGLTLFLIVIGVLSILAFYSVTNGRHLHNDVALDGADWSAYALCHRITERSFSIGGRQFPLCARCSGMYLGVALVVLVLVLAGRTRRALLPPLPLMVILFSFIFIMGVDGINSYSHFFPNAPHLYEPQNWLRLLTGMGTGVAMGLILLPALAQTLWQSRQYRPVISSFRELIELLALAFLIVILVLSNRTAILYVLALASVAGLLTIVTALNTVIMLVLFRQDGRANNWRQAAVPLAAGFLLAVVQLTVISLIRFQLTGTMAGFPGI
ncbi:MAG: DUF2085 domain-containing protein [Candidatus Promineifilaceae bacterium]|nr:DUF2085 domain-containing protein [Candidatus Promineifilaceae bacterium]